MAFKSLVDGGTDNINQETETELKICSHKYFFKTGFFKLLQDDNTLKVESAIPLRKSHLKYCCIWLFKFVVRLRHF